MTVYSDATRRQILSDLEEFRKKGQYPQNDGAPAGGIGYLLDQHQVATLLDHERRLQHLEARA